MVIENCDSSVVDHQQYLKILKGHLQESHSFRIVMESIFPITDKCLNIYCPVIVESGKIEFKSVLTV